MFSIKSLRNAGLRMVSVTICCSFAFSFSACGKKKSYKGEVDAFIDTVGSSLGGSKHVFESVEEASETFYNTKDLKEKRELKSWRSKDSRTPYFVNNENQEGFFYKGAYNELWSQLEDTYKNGTAVNDLYGHIKWNDDKTISNPTIAHLVALLEDASFGMATRSVELMCLYQTEESVYYANNYSLAQSHPYKYVGMRVIFKNSSDAKDYWQKFIDVDDAFAKCIMTHNGDEPYTVDTLPERNRIRLDAYHDMKSENYEYDEKKNEGHMTLYLGYRNINQPASYDFNKVLFSISISDREVTMLCCNLFGSDVNLKDFGKVYDKLGLKNPLDTKMVGQDENTTEEERNKMIVNGGDELSQFFSQYMPTFSNGPRLGVGVSNWDRQSFIYPTVGLPDHAAWVPYVYDDPQDYLDTLNEQ